MAFLQTICISFYNTVRHLFDCRYNEDTFIEKGIQYGDMFIKGTAREPPDFVVSEVCVSNVHCSAYVDENLNGFKPRRSLIMCFYL